MISVCIYHGFHTWFSKVQLRSTQGPGFLCLLFFFFFLISFISFFLPLSLNVTAFALPEISFSESSLIAHRLVTSYHKMRGAEIAREGPGHCSGCDRQECHRRALQPSAGRRRAHFIMRGNISFISNTKHAGQQGY